MTKVNRNKDQQKRTHMEIILKKKKKKKKGITKSCLELNLIFDRKKGTPRHKDSNFFRFPIKLQKEKVTQEEKNMTHKPIKEREIEKLTPRRIGVDAVVQLLKLLCRSPSGSSRQC